MIPLPGTLSLHPCHPHTKSKSIHQETISGDASSIKTSPILPTCSTSSHPLNPLTLYLHFLLPLVPFCLQVSIPKCPQGFLSSSLVGSKDWSQALNLHLHKHLVSLEVCKEGADEMESEAAEAHPSPCSATKACLLFFSFSHWLASVLRVEAVFLYLLQGQAQSLMQSKCVTECLGFIRAGSASERRPAHTASSGLCKTIQSPASLPSPVSPKPRVGQSAPPSLTHSYESS